ncbi:MAG: adenosylcobinamide-phosphate synthase CbiB [Proteobacteria bacterium]|nr:adenosylcobinamide-phosphate synthase CbiB [Pseudomonadota bacterium]
MEFIPLWYILPSAFVLDLILGDPPSFPHPIRVIGKAISFFEPVFRKFPVKLFTSGLLFCLFLIFASFSLTFFMVYISYLIHPVFGIIVEIILVYYCISVRSLKDAALDVMHAFRKSGLKEARIKLSMIVGRDTKNISEEGVVRAAVETVAENLVDGVISPLFFAAIGGAPFAISYKMINTLDSMVGYKNEKYIDFGKASAKIDDVANYIPARISIFIISCAAQMLCGKGISSFKTAVKEGSNHSSPNSGCSEAAFAGALLVKLGGPNYYGGQLISKPYIGVDFGEAQWIHIKKACKLMVLSSILALLFLWGIAIAFGRIELSLL